MRDYFKKQCGSNSSTVPAVYLLYLLRQGSETFIYLCTNFTIDLQWYELSAPVKIHKQHIWLSPISGYEIQCRQIAIILCAFSRCY